MRRVQLCAHRKAQTPGQRSTRRRTAAKMRVLGLARLLRAVCRRWLGGLIVVDDVQLSVFTGELELVDCELDGPKLTRLLARVGLRCRVVNARAAKVSVSLPITWRRGARIGWSWRTPALPWNSTTPSTTKRRRSRAARSGVD